MVICIKKLLQLKRFKIHITKKHLRRFGRTIQNSDIVLIDEVARMHDILQTFGHCIIIYCMRFKYRTDCPVFDGIIHFTWFMYKTARTVCDPE